MMRSVSQQMGFVLGVSLLISASTGYASSLQTQPAEAALLPTKLPPIYIERTLTLHPNEPLITLLSKQGFDKSYIYTALAPLNADKSMRKELARMRPGQKVRLTFQDDADFNPSIIHEMTFHTQTDRTLKVWRAEDGGYKAQNAERRLVKETATAVGAIDSSLYEAARDAGLPAGLVKPFANLFAWELDFTRDIQPGAAFKIVYEKVYDEKGNYVRNGDIIAAGLSTKGKNHFAFRHESKGKADYYDEQGVSKRKSLLRTPLEFTRISSQFNLKRRHPILGYTRAHKGTDFAAPTGTPIKASGDGVIEKASWYGGYGRYIRIQHNKTYKTAYAHLNAFAKGIRSGSKVKQGQIIGYVGTSGRSTGPHLHYELLKYGKHIDAMKEVLPFGDPLRGKEKEAFLRQVAAYKTMWDDQIQLVAQQTGQSLNQ